jgi:hypothetical protein
MESGSFTPHKLCCGRDAHNHTSVHVTVDRRHRYRKGNATDVPIGRCWIAAATAGISNSSPEPLQNASFSGLSSGRGYRSFGTANGDSPGGGAIPLLRGPGNHRLTGVQYCSRITSACLCRLILQAQPSPAPPLSDRGLHFSDTERTCQNRITTTQKSRKNWPERLANRKKSSASRRA